MSQPSSAYAQINGFYGPGTWAAWVITLIASWIPILQNDHKHNLHYIGYALYTNWAAVDLIRQWVPAFRHHKEFEEVDHTQVQNLLAPFAVMQAGIFHAFLQLWLCAFIAKQKDTNTKKEIEQRRVCIMYGLIFPGLTSIFVWPTLAGLMVQHDVVGSCIVTLTGWLIVGPLLFQASSHISWGTTLIILFIVYIPVYSATIIWSVFKTSNDIVMRTRCSVIPCAPQAIGDWDQAFSLFGALFLFVYEYQDLIIHLARKAFTGACASGKRLGKWLKSLLV